MDNVEALNLLHGVITSDSWRKRELFDRALELDKLSSGLGELYLQYMVKLGKPTMFIPKATELIVANSTKLGRILR